MDTLAPRKGMTAAEIERTVSAVIREATLEEKVAMMSGHGFFEQHQESGKRWGSHPYRAGGGCERLGVPALYFTDGPRGVARGNSTCFPSSMARGASFDVALERRIGEIMGIEARAQGCTLSGAVCVNLLRHPAWGRAQETYGEDPHLLGEMGAALCQGIQSHNVVATVKHLVLNSMENARFKVDVRCDDRTLREVYLPHFRRVLAAGCASVMSAYNKWNGEHCGQHRVLLTDILRGEWGFDGFVHSDWVFGVRQVYGVAAGLDVENPEPLVFGKNLVDAVNAGHVDPAVIDAACRRILRVIYRFACAEDPLEAYPPALVAQESHRAVALQAALESAVLLENHGVLPLDRTKIRRLAVLGRLAKLENTGDNGSSRVQPPYVVTALEGLRRLLGEHTVVIEGDESDLGGARRAADAADAVVVVVGYTAEEEGEFMPGEMSGGDRAELTLSDEQTALVRAAAESGKPTVVVLVAGSAVIVEDWLASAGALLQTFYAGMEGGTALAKLLFGEVSPSGRLPFSVAKRAEDYPFFDRDAESIEYGPCHGYSWFEQRGVEPRFAFGHGLSYARFTQSALSVRHSGDTLEVELSVRNEGDMAAAEVVLLYVSPPGVVAERPKRLLKAFARVALEPGEQRTVSVSISLSDLRWWNPTLRAWSHEAGSYVVSCCGRDGHELTRTIEL